MNEIINILIVDDDMGHATLIRKNLKRLGLKNPVFHFKDGQEILDFFFEKNSGKPIKSGDSYMMLLDIRMPKVDGVEVLKRIKAHDDFRKIPIIIITTNDDPRDIEYCYSIGCSGYIIKPIKYERFAETINNLDILLDRNDSPDFNSTGSFGMRDSVLGGIENKNEFANF